MTEGAKPPSSAPPRVPSDALIEELTADWGFHIRSAQQLESFASEFQAVEVHDTVPFGKLFPARRSLHDVREGRVLLSRESGASGGADAFAPVRALIVGGGDGGSAEELLKHPTIESVTLAEIDGAVVDISRKYFYAVHHGALDDPRLTLEIVDGFEYVRSCSGRFDLIVLDLTDPGGPSETLYTPDFYRACAARLTPSGAMTLHIASPIAHPQRIRATLASLRQAFPIVTPYLTSIPLYGGLVDDGVRIGIARRPNDERQRGRPPHCRRAASGPSLLQRRHALRALGTSQFRRDLVA
jgi:spermidine synthase